MQWPKFSSSGVLRIYNTELQTLQKDKPSLSASPKHMSYCLNSVKGVISAILQGSFAGLNKGDTGRLDYCSCRP